MCSEYLVIEQIKVIMRIWRGFVKINPPKFDNVRKPVIMFQKTNGLTGKGIAGAKFKVEYEQPGGGTKLIGSFTTDKDGKIIIPKGEVGWYVFTETHPAPGFSLPTNPVTRQYFSAGDNAYLPEFAGHYTAGTGVYASGYAPNDGITNGGISGDSIANNIMTQQEGSASAPQVSVTPQSVQVEAHSGSAFYVEGEGFNWPLNSIVIKKTSVVTGELLAGAAFELYRADEQQSGVPGTNIGRWTTDNSRVIVVTGLEPGYYIVKEVQAPPNFLISENSQQNGLLKADGTTVLEFSFANIPYGAILITKIDALTGEPLANARFKVTDAAGAVVGNTTGEYTTDSRGEILIPNVKPGSYVVTEIQAPNNYAINTTPRTVEVGTDGKTYKLSFDNYPFGTLVIKKLNSVTKEPLADAEFKITTAKGNVVGNSNGIFKTDEKGTIAIPNLEKGSYIVEETKAPTGFILENQTQAIEIEYGKTHTLEVFNKPKSSLQIIKIDAATKQPLKDAKFTIYHMNGEVLGHYTTDSDGLIIVDNIEPSWYKIVETKAPDGYILDDIPRDVEITHNQFLKVTFENKKLTSLQIKKIDAVTGVPLAGAQFEVEKQNGEHVGTYTTDSDGFINIPTLDPDWYVVREKKAPIGYISDETPKTVEVKTQVPTIVTFENKPMSGLKIIKLDSVTREPIANVEFTVAKMNGERIGNFKTDSIGQIYIDSLEDGYYTITEIKAAEGYLSDKEPKTVQIQWGKPTVLEVLNDPFPDLVIKKISSEDKKPIAGVKFLVTKFNGEQIGYYTTDRAGMIVIEGLEEGKYLVRETEAAKGFLLDETAHEVDIKYGKRFTLEVENKPMASILIRKIDSVTKEGIYGVKFLLYDAKDNPIGQFISDDQGYVWLDKELPAGKYKLRELEPAD